MRNKIIIFLIFLANAGVQGFAQNTDVTGVVLDRWKNPVSGALVTAVDNPAVQTTTDRDGRFAINVAQSVKLRISTSDNSSRVVEAETNEPMTITMGLASQAVNAGYDFSQNLEETTASVSTAYGDEINKRGARDIGSSLFGNVLGLTALQGAGTYNDFQTTFYVRGLQTLTRSGNEPLLLVDGIERDISLISPEEVESVTVLKDAAAVALYGYKGANGAVNIVTKRGKYGALEVKFSYDHAINEQIRRPKFADSYLYANAMNEALTNDGQSARYSAAELAAFQSGQYPYLYPNVDWIKEAFKNTGATNTYNMNFRGGGTNFRYYAMLNLQNNSGYVNEPRLNDGYSTQDQYSKGNLRTNLDVDLTPTTKLVLNLMGSLQEMRRPGEWVEDEDEADRRGYLWEFIYALPSAAFPVKTEDDLWGGSNTWAGTRNPVGMSRDAGYTKTHMRTLFADMTLKQDLSGILPGLGADFMLAYDNSAVYREKRHRTYKYGSDAVTEWNGNTPNLDNLSRYTGGAETGLATTNELYNSTRVFNTALGLNYKNTFGDHSIYSQFKWNYEYRNYMGLNQTFYRHNLSLYTHYGYLGRYFVDLSLVAAGANKLAPSSTWGYSPTVSAAWALSKEDFMADNALIDFLKLRASFGIINRDNLPVDGDGNIVERYWEQFYVSGTLFPIDAGFNPGSSRRLSRLATENPKHEQAYKYNLGLDATLLGGLNLTVDAYYENRRNIWVDANGKYSTVIGLSAPFENGGVVDSYGFEIGADYFKKINDFSFNIGVNFALNKNEIKEQYEEPRLYDNLVRTGNPVGQIYGMIAEGFFRDDADIAGSKPHLFNEVKPGDIKYRDVNGDGVVDANDVAAIGYNTLCPEIYYSFKLGAEWKGIGFTALFQGTGNYSAMLNTKSVYWPLINNTTISEHYYENRWTSGNMDAKYPRLVSQSSNNNFQSNTVWLEDRSFLKLRHVELYYSFSRSLMNKTSFMNRAKIYVRGVDLLCFDKIKIADPESYGVNNPLERSILLGLSIGF
ncbi:MAG: SusC/RagA family TonB-linked outer membrane protein [Tannerella sp.]|jgi:TonB-linked SusC/RagA family outer membrane protein|nr:SusC/RagA family TonB-linked outer membrane protein [Tannerella sp.]